MTKTSTFKFFVQEKVEKGEITIEQTKEISAVIKQSNPVSPNAQQKAQAHQAIRAIFETLNQSACEARSPHHQANQGGEKVHATSNPSRVLEVPVVNAADESVLAYLQLFFQSDRSPCEILKLSNRLFILGQAYNKKSK